MFRPRFSNLSFLWLLVLAAVPVAQGLDHFDFSVPPCGFRRWVGFPCVFCGGWRSVVALGSGSWPAAFAFNPLVASAIAGAGIALVVGGLQAVRAQWAGSEQQRLARESNTEAKPWLTHRRNVTLLILAVIANWIYLIIHGR